MIKVFSVMQATAAGPPGKLVEVCGNLKKNEVIDWTFTADKDYCWMWNNKAANAAGVKFQLIRR